MSAISCLLLLALAAAAPSLAWAATTDCRCAPAAAPVCGSDGATYDSKCALDCAWAGKHSGLSAVHEGPCGADSNATTAVQAAVRDASTKSPTDAIRDFEGCQTNCATDGNSCGRSSCGGLDNSCFADCMRTVVSCTCACTEALKNATSGTSVEDARAPLLSGDRTNRTSLLRTLAAPVSLRGAGNDMVDCNNNALTSYDTCKSNCKSNVACLLKCAKDTGEKVCRCGAAGLGRPLLLVLAVSALAWAFK